MRLLAMTFLLLASASAAADGPEPGNFLEAGALARRDDASLGKEQAAAFARGGWKRIAQTHFECANDPFASIPPAIFRLDAEGKVTRAWRQDAGWIARCFEARMIGAKLARPPHAPFYTSFEFDETLSSRMVRGAVSAMASKEDLVVFQPDRFALAQAPQTFALSPAGRAMGGDAWVCVAMADAPAAAGSARNTATRPKPIAVSATLTTMDGRAIPLGCHGTDERLVGRITFRQERLLCATTCRSGDLPAGASIRTVALSSGAPLQALGAYWTSRTPLDTGH